jgi:hypothetical protein
MHQPIIDQVKIDGYPAAFYRYWFFRAASPTTRKEVYKDEDGTEIWAQPIELNSAGQVPDQGEIYLSKDEYYYFLITDNTIDSVVDPLLVDPAHIIKAYPEWQADVGRLGDDPFDVQSNRNYFLNSQWRFYTKQSFLAADLPAQETEIAPEGWYYRRNNTNSNIKLEFKPFVAGQSNVFDTPTNYLSAVKTDIGAGGETQNDIVYYLGNIQDFNNVEMSIGIWGNSSTSSTIQVLIEQYFGTGGSSTTTTSVGLLTYSGTWSKQSTTFNIPSISGKAIGTGDTYTKVILRMPLNEIHNILFGNTQINRSATLLSYDKKSYYDDLIDRNSYDDISPTDETAYYPKVSVGNKEIYYNDTGFVQPMFRASVPEGYRALDGTTLVTTDKVESKYNPRNINVTNKRLYDVWENDALIGNGNAFGYGEDGFYPYNYPTGGANLVFVNEKKNTAITAWTAETSGFTITNSRTGADRGFESEIVSESYFNISLEGGAYNRPPFIYLAIENVQNGVATPIQIGTLPATMFRINLIQTGTAALKQATFISTTGDVSELAAGSYFLISSTTINYYVWFTVNNVGTDPTVPARTGIKIDIYKQESATTFMTKIKNALLAVGNQFNVKFVFPLRVRRTAVGAVSATTQGTTKTVIDFENTGTATIKVTTELIFTSAEFIAAGSYFLISNPTINYYIWFKKDGVGTDPAIPARTGLLVNLNSSDSYLTVLWKIKKAIEGKKETVITNIPVATGLAGKYFYAYNSSVQFYVWYTVDGVGTDPAVVGKTGIKVELIGTDTAVQVSQKTSKAISSYYYTIPAAEGYFLRAWNNSKLIDLGAELRLPRGDGTSGDNVGTIQSDTNRSHHHAGSVGTGTQFWAVDGLVVTQYTEYDSAYPDIPIVGDKGFEARPRNINVLYCIKY